MTEVEQCARTTSPKLQRSCACRPLSCGCMLDRGALRLPNQANAGCSSRKTLLSTSVSFTLFVGKRR